MCIYIYIYIHIRSEEPRSRAAGVPRTSVPRPGIAPVGDIVIQTDKHINM